MLSTALAVGEGCRATGIRAPRTELASSPAPARTTSAPAPSAREPTPQRPKARRLLHAGCALLEDGRVLCPVQVETGCGVEELRPLSPTTDGRVPCALRSSGSAVFLEEPGCPPGLTEDGAGQEQPLNVALTCARGPDGSVDCEERGHKKRRQFEHSRALAEGQGFYCALGAQGDVWCWGQNEGGLGDGRHPLSAKPVRVLLEGPALELTVGLDHGCALLATGRVSCWGDNRVGQVGVGRLPSPGDVPDPESPASYFRPQTVRGLPPAVTVAAVGTETCALTQAGEVYCWGDHFPGASQATAVPSPTRVPELPVISQLVVGEPDCALSADGDVYCWGDDSCPVLELGSQPVKIEWPAVGR